MKTLLVFEEVVFVVEKKRVPTLESFVFEEAVFVVGEMNPQFEFEMKTLVLFEEAVFVVGEKLKVVEKTRVPTLVKEVLVLKFEGFGKAALLEKKVETECVRKRELLAVVLFVVGKKLSIVVVEKSKEGFDKQEPFAVE